MANPVSISKLMIPFIGTGSFILSPLQLKQRDSPWLFPLSLSLSSLCAVVPPYGLLSKPPATGS